MKRGFSSLQSELQGAIVTPDRYDYDAARGLWNGLIDRRPAAIVRCATTQDVVATVRYARDHDLPLAVRAGGHNVAGRAIVDGGIVADLSRMRGVEVDAGRRLARVQGGALLGDIDRETQRFGLAAPLGVVSETGVGGFTLHGGYGWLSRREGLAIDSLHAVDMVLADGRRVHASSTEHPDLFWAIRGGGGNLGVVTSFEFRLCDVGPRVWHLAVFYPMAEAGQVLRAFRDTMAEAPEALGALATLWSGGEEAPWPLEARGAPLCAIVGCWTGPVDEGEAVLAPLRGAGRVVADFSGPTLFVDVQRFLDPDYPRGRLYYWKSSFVPALSDEAIARVVERGERRPSALSSIDLWALGGAIARVRPEATAFPHRDAPFLVASEANWEEPAASEDNIRWARGTHEEIERETSGATYLNFAGLGEGGEALVRRAYAGNLDRLRAVKAKYDPDNLFRENFNVPPHPQGQDLPLQPL